MSCKHNISESVGFDDDLELVIPFISEVDSFISQDPDNFSEVLHSSYNNVSLPIVSDSSQLLSPSALRRSTRDRHLPSYYKIVTVRNMLLLHMHHHIF